jgi:hypothetical protein
MDGISFSAGNPGSAGMTSLDLGSDQNGGGTSSLTGDIAEIIVYSGTLSTSDRLGVQLYLKAKYAL